MMFVYADELEIKYCALCASWNYIVLVIWWSLCELCQCTKKKKIENILLMRIGDKNDIDDDLC